MAEQLAPCPFCGNAAEFKPYKRDGLTLQCKSPGCVVFNQRTLRCSLEWLRQWMVEHWNTRAAPKVEREALTDEQLSAIALKGYDDYWTEDCAGKEEEAWAASAKAVIAAITQPARAGGKDAA